MRPTWTGSRLHRWAALIFLLHTAGCVIYSNYHLILCPVSSTRRSRGASLLFYFYSSHICTLKTLHLPDKDINFLLVAAVFFFFFFARRMLTLLIHYSQCIVERALLLNGISRDDLISHDWCQQNTLYCNLFPLSYNTLHLRHVHALPLC